MKDKQIRPMFFASQSDFRKWLQKHHKTKAELLVGFYKVGSGKPSMSWSQSVDEALCFGWIDGVRKFIDKDSYQIRFTPRNPTSVWSATNIKKVEALTRQGLMKPAGVAIFKKRLESKSRKYSYEKSEPELSVSFKEQFKANKKAWDYFQSLAPSYKKVSVHWVMSAAQEATRLKRLRHLIEDSSMGTNQWKDNKYKK